MARAKNLASRTLGRVTEEFSNPTGSVGKPKDGEPARKLALLTANEWAVSIERVDYDALALAREIRNLGLPAELAEQLVRAA